MTLTGRTIIVTGAGGGVGRAIALALAAQGSNVVVNDYGGTADGTAGTQDRADAVVAEIRSAGGQAISNSDAVGSYLAAQSIRDAAMTAFGGIDGLINNAGIMIPGKVDDLSDEQIVKTIEINYLGAFRLIRAIWPIMRERGHGRIVNVSSNSAFGFGGLSAYGSTKAALMGLTMDMAQEGKHSDIRVNSILPVSYSRLTSGSGDGRHKNQTQTFVGWLKDNFPPEHIAAVAAYLVSADCAVTGKHFTVGGGRFAEVEAFVRSGYYDQDLDFEKVSKAVSTEPAREGCFIKDAIEELNAYATFSPISLPPAN